MRKRKVPQKTTRKCLNTDVTVASWKRYRELAQAIVMQAAIDHRQAWKTLRKYQKKDPRKPKVTTMIERQEWVIADCENFFRSEWFRMLSPNMSSDYLMKKLKTIEAEDAGREGK